MQQNKKQWKKWLATASVASLAATALTGCGGDTADTASQSPQGSAAAVTPAKPLELSVMLPVFNTSYPKDGSPVLAEIEKKTNTKIHIDWVPNSSYNDKFNITLASSKLPSIMYVPDTKSSSFVNAAKSGAFWDVAPYLKNYKNLGQSNKTVLENYAIDGKTYGIYRSRALGRNGINFRQDWLENVGLQAPKTIDDFYNMLKAFKEKDPDKNGKDDTYGMVLVKWTGTWASGFDTIKLWFGAPNKWGVANGALVPEHETAEYLEALKFMRKLFEEKLINQDFAVYDSAKWVDPVVNGKAGVIVDVSDTAGRIEQKIHDALKAANKDEPNKQFVDNSIGVEGKNGLKALPTTGYAGILAIPKSSVKTEEELKQVLQFIDQSNEAEIQTLLYSGIEGKHYTKDTDGFIIPSTDTALNESEVAGLGQMLTYIPETRTLKSKKTQTPLSIKTEKMQKEAEKYIVPNPAESLISKVYSQKGPQLDNIINDARIKYIVGQSTEADWKAAVELWRKSGGEDYVKEISELYAAASKK